MKKRVQQAREIIDIQPSILEMPKERAEYIEKSMAIANYISNFIQTNDYKQKDVADKLGKTEAEVSRWLSGLHNLTLKSILKLESVLPIHILNPEITGSVTPSLTYYGSVNVPFSEMTPIQENYTQKYGEKIGNYLAVVGGLALENNTTTIAASGEIRA